MSKLIKYKKTILISVFFVSVLCITAVLAGAFSAESTPSMENGTAGDRPCITWEAIRNLAEGDTKHQDILRSYYYEDIGFGLCIARFPIKDAGQFSLNISFAGLNEKPMAIRLCCEHEDIWLDLNVENLGIMMDLHKNNSTQQEINKLFYNKQYEKDIRTLVETFGKILQNIWLLAPEEQLAAIIKENYSSYVTAELLQKWQADPQSAPGRVVSSPWPERIDIRRIELSEKNQYVVYGEVIEVTSVEYENGGVAAKRPIKIEVRKEDGCWIISDVTVGEFVQLGSISYENMRYGFSFYLPKTWEGYMVVEEQWEGTDNGKTVESGSQLLIRHPDWVEEAPRQDVPIMIFTFEQWNALQKGEFTFSAAPIGPSKLGSNSKYVFALPARYNYGFPTGFEEVEEILKDNALCPREPFKNSIPGEKITIGEIIATDDNVKTIEPSQTIKASPELIEQAKQSEEELTKTVAGLFDTVLEITPQEEKIELDFYLHNISGEALDIYFGSSQEFDIFITNNSGLEVYRWANNKCFAAAIINKALKKDEKLHFSEVWDYKDNNGSSVLPGEYIITVKILAKLENRKNINTDELIAAQDFELVY